MPSTNDSRAIKITASTGNVAASTFDLNFTSSFSSTSNVTVKFSDESDHDTDKTIHGLDFVDASTGTVLASLSIRVKACTNNLGGFSSTETIDSRSSLDPAATGAATQIRTPSTSNLRKWTQNVTQGGSNVLRNVAVIDVRSLNGSATATQTVRSNDERTYALAVNVETRAGAVASGLVSIETVTTAGAGFEPGKVVITDTEDDAPATRTVIR